MAALGTRMPGCVRARMGGPPPVRAWHGLAGGAAAGGSSAPPRWPSRRELTPAGPGGHGQADGRADPGHAEIRRLAASEGAEEALDRLEHRAVEVEDVGDRSRARDRLPHQEAACAARAQTR